jgi:hypothetical protein
METIKIKTKRRLCSGMCKEKKHQKCFKLKVNGKRNIMCDDCCALNRARVRKHHFKKQLTDHQRNQIRQQLRAQWAPFPSGTQEFINEELLTELLGSKTIRNNMSFSPRYSI